MMNEADKPNLQSATADIIQLVDGHVAEGVPGAFQRWSEDEFGRRIVMSHIPERSFISITEEVRPPGTVKIKGRKWNSKDPANESFQERRALISEGKRRREFKKNGFRERDIGRISKLLIKFKDQEGING